MSTSITTTKEWEQYVAAEMDRAETARVEDALREYEPSEELEYSETARVEDALAVN